MNKDLKVSDSFMHAVELAVWKNIRRQNKWTQRNLAKGSI